MNDSRCYLGRRFIDPGRPFREWQRRALHCLASKLSSTNTRHVQVRAPTGAGKTKVLQVLASWLACGRGTRQEHRGKVLVVVEKELLARKQWSEQLRRMYPFVRVGIITSSGVRRLLQRRPDLDATDAVTADAHLVEYYVSCIS